MKTYPEIQFLESLSDFGIKLGLDKIGYLVEKLGNPHKKYFSVLVAGTNGKGTVCRTLSEILIRSGYKTGLYISPHLIDVRERIRINGQYIEQNEFLEGIRRIKRIIEKMPLHMYPTYFEALTAIAFHYFYSKNVDIAVCEVGLGGRFDATNVLPSKINVITKIGLEHTAFLGNTYQAIASEKAGIIKEKSKVVTSKQKKEAEQVIVEKAKLKNSTLYIFGKDFRATKKEETVEGIVFDFFGKATIKNLKITIIGTHQIENISLAIESALLLNEENFKITADVIRNALMNVQWEGRMEIIRKSPYIIFDGAHNPDGVKILMKNLKKYFPFKFKFLVGILKDKDYKKMLSYIVKYNPSEIVFTMPETERAVEPETLTKFVKNGKVKVIKNIEGAIKYISQDGNHWCIFGSLYLYSSVVKYLKTEKEKSGFTE